MGQEYPWEVRERAEDLYIVDGLTFDQVAVATGVSGSQLKRWSDADHWQERKQEYRQALGEIRRKTVELRRNLIIKAAQSLDPQDVYAVARMEAIFARGRGKEVSSEQSVVSSEEGKVIRTPADAVAALEEVVERKLNGMLSRPETLSLNGIKDLKKSLELIEELKTRYRSAAPGEESLDDDDENRRRLVAEVDRLLGVSR